MSSTRSSERSNAAARRAARLGLVTSLVFAWLVEPGGPTGPLRFHGRRLPVLCPFRRLTGRRCPGCGMTRGLVYMLRLRTREAVRANPLSPLALAFIIATALRASGRRYPSTRLCGLV